MFQFEGSLSDLLRNILYHCKAKPSSASSMALSSVDRCICWECSTIPGPLNHPFCGLSTHKFTINRRAPSDFFYFIVPFCQMCLSQNTGEVWVYSCVKLYSWGCFELDARSPC